MSFLFRRGNRSRSNQSVPSINSALDDEDDEVQSATSIDRNTRVRSSSLQQEQQTREKEEEFNHDEDNIPASSSSLFSSETKIDNDQSSGLIEISESDKRKISFTDESEQTPPKSSDNIFSPFLTTKGNYKVTPNSNRRNLNRIPSSLRLDPKTFTRKNSIPQLFSSPRNPISLPFSKLNDSKSGEGVVFSRSSSQQVVIIEIGRKYFKCGISGEYCPRVVIPIPFELSEMLCKCKNFYFNVNHMKKAFLNFENEIGSCNIETDVIFDEYSQVRHYGNKLLEDDAFYEEKLTLLLGKQLRRIFIDELKVNLDNIDHVVILESIYSLHENLVRRIVEDTCNRNRFSKLKGVKFINSQCCALIPSSCSITTQKQNDSKTPIPIIPTLNLTSKKANNEELDIHGLVIDCGYSECKIVPIIFGNIIQSGVEIIGVGSKHLLTRLKENLIKMNSKEALTPQSVNNVDPNKLFCENSDQEEIEKYNKIKDLETMLLEDIFTRVCYCDGEGDNPLVPFSDVVKYWNGRFCVSIPDKIRRDACDIVFEPLIEGIVTSLKHVETEQRSKVMKNLLVCGGLAEIAGFKKKLLRKLRDVLCEKDISRSWLKNIGVNMDEIVSPSILNWYGASIICSQL